MRLYGLKKEQLGVENHRNYAMWGPKKVIQQKEVGLVSEITGRI